MPILLGRLFVKIKMYPHGRTGDTLWEREEEEEKERTNPYNKYNTIQWPLNKPIENLKKTFDLQTYKSEFESHWVTYSYGLVLHLIKKPSKLLNVLWWNQQVSTE